MPISHSTTMHTQPANVCPGPPAMDCKYILSLKHRVNLICIIPTVFSKCSQCLIATLAAFCGFKMCCFKMLMVSRSSQTRLTAATKPEHVSSQSSKRRVSVYFPHFRKIKCQELYKYVSHCQLKQTQRHRTGLFTGFIWPTMNSPCCQHTG